MEARSTSRRAGRLTVSRPGSAGEAFRGRVAELDVITALMAGAREGRSGALVVSGEAGVGKSALLDRAVSTGARGITTQRMVASESEIELTFSGLQMLVERLLPSAQLLPQRQRESLESALGLRESGTPNPFVVGLAVKQLFAHVAAAGPLMCIVDDAQWLDRASARTLAFVARRLRDEGVVMIFAMREVDDQFADLPQLHVEGLGDADADALLSRSLAGAIDRRVRDQLLAEARGNPLALQVLPQSMSPAELAGGFAVANSIPFESRIEQSLLAGLEAVDERTRLLILVASADPTGDPELLFRACTVLGLGNEHIDAAVRAGALLVGPRIAFRHPLIRSAVYRAAAAEQRRAAHSILAEATDAERDPDRRAWHRAAAAMPPSEEIAGELERSAERARARGGMAANAAFLLRAAELSPGSERYAERLIAAAAAEHDAGAPERTLQLLDVTRDLALTPRQAAEEERLRARAGYALRRDRTAPRQLLRAARGLEPFDTTLARDTYMEALSAAQSAGRLGEPGAVTEIAEAILEATDADSSDRAQDLILRGQALLFARGPHAARPTVDRAIQAFLEHPPDPLELHWMWSGARAAQDLWDSEGMRILAERQVELARASGTLSVLPPALNMLMVVNTFDGHLDAAEAVCDEIDVILNVTGHPLPKFGRVFIAAYRGHVEEVERSTVQLRADGYSRGEGYSLTVANFAEALVYNGAGRYEDALVSARGELPFAHELGHAMRALVELVEAATRTGETDLARDAVERLEAVTRPASDRNWAKATMALVRAQLRDGEEAESFYRDAIELYTGIRVPMLAARSRLLYGEMLRRTNRLADARVQLRAAHTSLRDLGMNGFATRAEGELRATGERVRSRTPHGADGLTAQESAVARLARDGLTNREIATRLFISSRTAEYHLRKVFVKLGINSRNDLARALDDTA
ncbi:AAA family ATPase [Humibacter albus]|uniref:AAA family ATPase n=1 Tax=Humibacter albus TaxID=427754 RepID=UPI0003B6C6F4|nr:LuxR family transcriptional regulator [Humibacter albus]